MENAKDAALSDKREIVSAAAKAVKIPFLDLGSLTSAMDGLKLAEGFKEREGRKEETSTRSRSVSVSESVAGSRQSSRSRSRTRSAAGSPERTPSPSPERGAAGGRKRAIVDIDMFEKCQFILLSFLLIYRVVFFTGTP